MWHAISQYIQDVTGESFTLVEKQQILTGDTCRSYELKGLNQHQHYFVKIAERQFQPMFEAELSSLKHLAQSEAITVPKAIGTDVSLEFSFLILNYYDLTQETPAKWHRLGQQLAKLHLSSDQKKFGWHEDNVIGKTPQPNRWSANWRTFFIEQRIAWQLQLLQEQSIFIGDNDHIQEICFQLLANHHPTPSLLHGDLWRGNIGFTETGPIIFDPASYYGDKEVDLAMTELFGVFPKEFYQGYQLITPISPQFQTRKFVYNFYHILNHCNLFGGEYINQAKATLNRLITLT